MRRIGIVTYGLIKRVLSRLYLGANVITTNIYESFIWFRTSKPFRQANRSELIYNTFFDSQELPKLSNEINELMHVDRYLRHRVLQKGLQGIRGWEYGKLLHYFKGNFSGLQILDIGPGNSTFPAFLAKKGSRVTTIDYPMPLEDLQLDQRQKMWRAGVTQTQGTMLCLPFEQDCFDLVTCISTIEHLDTSPHTQQPIPYEQFIRLTQQALLEMTRVIRPGGFLYLTTETFEPTLQQHDNWYTEIPYDGIGAAYRLEDITSLFVEVLLRAKCRFIEPVKLEPDLLLHDANRSNFRGRYITTFCILAQKLA